MGLVLGLLLCAAGLAGYGVVVYYNRLFLLILLLILAAPTVKRQPSGIAYLCSVVMLLAFSAAGALTGHEVRRLHCRSKSSACEPLLELVQKHRDEHGRYPSALSEVQGFALAQRGSGLDIAQGDFSSHGISLDGINAHDALIYLDANFMSCVVPVTKRLPMSITRLYVYRWSSDTRSWRYDKLVWNIGEPDK